MGRLHLSFRTLWAVLAALPFLGGCTPQLIGGMGSLALTNGGGGGLKIEVPIEMLEGMGLGSNGANVRGTSLQTLDTGDYDGTVTYQFEIVAQNGSLTSRQVFLKNQADTVTYATINVPASTASTRYRTSFTPTPGAGTYGISIEATPSNYDVIVTAGRMLVQQSGATTTKIYIPLMTGEEGAGGVYHQDAFADLDAIDATNSNPAYVQAHSLSGGVGYMIWTKNAGKFATLQGATPWTFQAMIYGETGATADACLWDITAAGCVANVVNSAAGVRQLRTVGIADASLIDGRTFEVRLRKSVAGTNAYIHKAGLWAKLSNLSKAEVYYLVGRTGEDSNASYIMNLSRMSVDVSTLGSMFTTPKVFLQNTGFYTTGAGTSQFLLVDDGATTSGTGGGGSAVAGSQTTFAATRTMLRSSDVAAALSTTSASNYLFGAVRTGGDRIWTSGSLVVVEVGP